MGEEEQLRLFNSQFNVDIIKFYGFFLNKKNISDRTKRQ